MATTKDVKQRFAPACSRPSSLDWQAQRVRITALYEHHTVPQVRDIMAEKHNFHASIRMFRSHLSNWGRDKKKKWHEMQALAIDAAAQRANGEQDIYYVVRGRLITFESLQRYFQRLGTSVERVAAQGKRKESALITLESLGAISSSSADQRPVHGTIGSAPQALDGHSSLPCNDEPVPGPEPNSRLAHLQNHRSANKSNALSADYPSPSYTQMFSPAMPEQAIRAMTVYIEGSFDSGWWAPAQPSQHFYVSCTSPDASPCVLYHLMNKLFCRSRLAGDLFANANYKLGQTFLTSSLDGIRQIVKSLYPPLPLFLPQTLLALTSRGVSVAAYTIIFQFATCIRDQYGPEHPIHKFFQCLARVDPSHLHGTINSIIQANKDAICTRLGSLHRSALGVRYGALHGRMYRSNRQGFYRGLRRIISECSRELSRTDVRTVVFQLHLARWLLKTSSSIEDRLEGQRIIAYVQDEWLLDHVDQEVEILLAQVHIANATNDLVVLECARRSQQSNMAKNCWGQLCCGIDGCLASKLFWPSLNLWEAKSTLSGEIDGKLIRHFESQ